MVAWPRSVAREEKGDGRVNMSILDMMGLDGWSQVEGSIS